jgi:hypothetical protein
MNREYIYFYDEIEAFTMFMLCLEKGIYASIDRKMQGLYGVVIDIDKTMEAKNATTETEK